MEVWEMGKVAKKVSVFLLLAASLVFFSFAAEAGVITITNRCGDDIYYLYISSSGTSNWEEDILGPSDILEDRATLRVNVQGSFRQFDLRAEDDEGNSLEWYGFPGNTTRITLHDDGTAEYE